MKVIFDKAILCNVVPVNYNGNTYWKAHVYSGTSLFKVSVPEARVDEVKKAVPHLVNFSADLREFTDESGKTNLRYYISDDTTIQILGV
jgi:hypothetical protein